MNQKKRQFSRRLNEEEEGPVSSKICEWNSPNQSEKKKNKIKRLIQLKGIGEHCQANQYLHFRGLRRRRVRERDRKFICRNNGQNFSNLEKCIQNQEVQKVPNKMNPKRLTSSHTIKVPKVKERREFLQQQEKNNL